MPLDRPSVKARARQLIRTSNPSVLTASLIMTALGVLITLLSNRLTGVSADVAKRYLEYYESGNLDAAFNVILTNTPSSGAQFIGLLLNCVSIILALGFTIFLLNTLRRTGPVLGNLLDGFAYWWKLLVLDFVCAIFIFLWSLLLIVPGICASYSYRMAFYLLADNPDWTPLRAIQESKKLMYGHRWRLAWLDCSFIGWFLLVFVTWGLAGIFVMPYFAAANAAFYEDLLDRTGR